MEILTALEIVRAHEEKGAEFVMDECGVPKFHYKGKKCLIGICIPTTIYYNSVDLESMTLAEIRLLGLISVGDYVAFRAIDMIQVVDRNMWKSKIGAMINGERKSRSR